MKTIIIKLFTETITDKEFIKLQEWLKDPKNQEKLECYVRDYYDLNISTLKNDVDSAYKKVMHSIEYKKKASMTVPLYKRNFFKYAAAILIFVSAGYFFLTKDNAQITEPTIVNNNIKIGTDKATLTLEDGTNVTLEKGETYIADNISSNGEGIIYKASETSKSVIVYNYLTIPRGGQYFIKLSDGTQVWLNSESKLKYPVDFIEGETRQVELVYGEAYFDVSPSTEHNNSRFKVQTGLQEVEVLGTEFNIKAYQDENFIYTSLVEGKVSVSSLNQNAVLKPREQSVINNNGEIIVSNVDINSVVDWMRGVFSFKGKPLEEICKILSRWYDVDVVIENKDFKNITFKGVIKKSNTIELILETLINSSDLNTYEIKDKTIYIK